MKTKHEHWNQLPDEHSYWIDEDEEDTQANKYLTFRLDKESMGFSIEYVLEIIEIQMISEIPDTPIYLKGVINLRGKIIPVIDLRIRLKMPERPYDKRTCIIICKIENYLIGLIVDTVEEVVEIKADQIEPAPRLKMIEESERFIAAIGKIEKSIKLLLNIHAIINVDDLQPIAEVQ